MVDHDDLTVVTMGMDDTCKNQQESRKMPPQAQRKMLLIIRHTKQHTLTEANQAHCKFTIYKLPKTVNYRNKLVSRPKESIKSNTR